MGSRGNGPRPFTQHQASTIFLRVPAVDWVPILHGAKTEFRATPNAVTRVDKLELPTPVVAYRVSGDGATKSWDHRMMVLTESWMEPLGAISEASLERENFPDMEHFRRYWMARTHRRFRPLQRVRVYMVRTFKPDDWSEFAHVYMERLYGDFYP